MITQLHLGNFKDWCANAAALTPAALPIVLDVREPWELQTASVTAQGFTLLPIPMHEVPSRVAELEAAYGSSHPIACLCHHGVRSLQVAHFLAQRGFTRVVNLQGGIAAWSAQLDASVPHY